MESPNFPAPWQRLPDVILLKVFTFMPMETLLNVSEVCRSWYRVAYDELLWKDLFYRTFKISRKIPRSPGKTLWRHEYRRLHFHIPKVESEVLSSHKDQVLHVSFSHNGEMFASSSKDGSIKVWDATFPAKLKYSHNLKELTWKYTQYSQFNSSDTLLLVSGVHFGSYSTSGEIAVFSLLDNFQLQCRVLNKPYDIFGTWYNNSYLLSGTLYWLGNLSSCSAIWLNKADQAPESEHESVYMRMFKFENENGSSIRTLMVANCLTPSTCSLSASSTTSSQNTRSGHSQSEPLLSSSATRGTTSKIHTVHSEPRAYRYLWDEPENDVDFESDDNDEMTVSDQENDIEICSKRPQSDNDMDVYSETSETVSTDTTASDLTDKYLIFTTGTKTYTPHLVGIKRLFACDARHKIETTTGSTIDARDNDNIQGVNNVDYDRVDHLIDLHGHIIGMCLSPCHRFLYVNSRPWPRGYIIVDPYDPPPIAQEIDIHVIDLTTMKEVDKMHRSHKAYTPNDECFFIFLDVGNEYVASGAEDKHGYLWDRHYGVLLQKYPHADVVNSVAFNPRDPEMMITASDDNTIKVWRSLNREQEIKDKKLGLKWRNLVDRA
ncbi:F-box/WD repeat-containing protein 5-like [Tubulanus polymorphus]|uniref:F-box/WD repeat-containing protein 5-like n=1 Tax=Tubulanus polymorphus TaxID=672921 RepID=UPI003DA570B8